MDGISSEKNSLSRLDRLINDPNTASGFGIVKFVAVSPITAGYLKTMSLFLNGISYNAEA